MFDNTRSLLRVCLVAVPVLLTGACASQTQFESTKADADRALAVANEAKATADKALAAAQQATANSAAAAQAAAQSAAAANAATEKASRIFQKGLRK